MPCPVCQGDGDQTEMIVALRRTIATLITRTNTLERLARQIEQDRPNDPPQLILDVTTGRYDMRAVGVAKAFHQVYESLSESHGWKTQKRTQVPWDKLPEANQRLMVDTVQTLLDAKIIANPQGSQ